MSIRSRTRWLTCRLPHACVHSPSRGRAWVDEGVVGHMCREMVLTPFYLGRSESRFGACACVACKLFCHAKLFSLPQTIIVLHGTVPLCNICQKQHETQHLSHWPVSSRWHTMKHTRVLGLDQAMMAQ
jgi:hypothetical protein